jgi:hypothetical protein
MAPVVQVLLFDACSGTPDCASHPQLLHWESVPHRQMLYLWHKLGLALILYKFHCWEGRVVRGFKNLCPFYVLTTAPSNLSLLVSLSFLTWAALSKPVIRGFVSEMHVKEEHCWKFSKLNPRLLLRGGDSINNQRIHCLSTPCHQVSYWETLINK